MALVCCIECACLYVFDACSFAEITCPDKSFNILFRYYAKFPVKDDNKIFKRCKTVHFVRLSD